MTFPSYDESLTISTSGANIYSALIKTESKWKEYSSPQPQYRTDMILRQTLERYNLTYLSIGISESSSNNVHGYNLPVGTSIQYKQESNTNKDISHDLIKLLSFKNVLCENVEKDFFGNRIKALSQPDGSFIVMLVKDAYSLCHSNTLQRQIVSTSPCRDVLGVFSVVPPHLNEMSITNRASWISASKEQGGINTEKVLHFSRLLNEKQNVTLANILHDEVDLMESCPLTTSSKIIKDKTTYNLKEKGWNMNQELTIQQKDTSPYFQIQKSVNRIQGVSHKGKLLTQVQVGDMVPCPSNKPVQVSIVDTYTNVIHPLYHSIKISSTQGDIPLNELDYHLEINEDGSSTLSFTTLMERNSMINIEMDYRPKFLSFEEFPADPNRGIDVLPSIASLSCMNTDNTDSFDVNPILTVYSNSLLLMPPVPDLSMPFNVMSITCTFLALIIGSTINITIRKSREKMRDKFNGIETPTLKQKLKAKIVNLKEKLLIKRKKDSPPPSSNKDKVE